MDLGRCGDRNHGAKGIQGVERSNAAGFLSDGLVEQARMAARESTGVLTYLVNAIESVHDANRSALIPYSMMSAVEPHRVDFLGEDWQDDHIALNEWAANELNASLGDAVKVSSTPSAERRKLQ